MKNATVVGLKDVQAVYSGPEGQLWELVMGQQIHIGGFRSSMDLAEKAGIGPGMAGVDLCCCNGAGMRFLVRFRNVARMHGVDATETVVELGRCRCEAEGLADRIKFTLGDACDTELPAASADFVWGEDAWCYVVDKKRLIAEAGPAGEARRDDRLHRLGRRPNAVGRRRGRPLSHFMKFPNTLTLDGYAALLAATAARCWGGRHRPFRAPHRPLPEHVEHAVDVRCPADHRFRLPLMESLGGEMNFMRDMAHAGKIAQGLFIARKKALKCKA